MALIQSMERLAPERPKVHAPTRCTFFTFIGDDRQRYLQLDTYGSSTRKFVDKVSQQMQFNRESAAELIAALRECFPDLG
jgi:hypothetical protein